MTTFRSSALRGACDVSPLLLGVIPFGLICGAACVGAGMPEWGAVGLSLIVFAGASQLATVQLMAEQASVAVVILTGLVVNLRMLMYSASLAPHLTAASPLARSAGAYLLTDQAYAVSIARFAAPGARPVNNFAYYTGAGLLMWTGFNLCTALGAHLGALIPAAWSLDFSIPLTFIALVIPAVRDRPALIAALAAGITACLAATLPFNLGLILASATGIAAGYLAERRSRRTSVRKEEHQ
ncbi:MAG: AzlC family ABC transporter permease [Pseudomonadota bacterium]